MKFIESDELRDWVKENLRKTIFTNAHALAVQTGCEVLVKLQDNMDIYGRQYYATHNLQRDYINNGLRKHPAEMLVSGETGLPAVNQGTQIGDEAKGNEPNLPTDNGVETDEPVLTTTSSNQTDDNSGEAGEVQVKMEAMSGDEDSNDTNQDSLRDGESGTDIDTYANVSPLSRSHGNSSQQRLTSPLTSQSPQHLYQCAICQKTFRTINILQMHTQTFHMTQRSMSSMISPNRMLNVRGKARGGRKSYGKQEQEQRRYPCPMCERTFHHPDLLKDHVSRSHMGQSILASSLKGIPVSSSTVTTDTSSSPLPSSSSSSQSQGPVTSSVPGSSSSSQGFQDSAGPSSAAEEDLDQQIQMSPVKQLMKTETFLGNLGNHPPSSLFSPSSTPSPFKHPGGGVSSRNSMPASNQGEPKGPMPISKIMKAILAIGGPVSTANTVKDNLRNRNYERVTNELFVEAANQLKDFGLGYLVACKNGSGRLVDVFIKKPPEEVVDILSTNSCLCDPTVYATTFASQTPVRLMRSSQLMENLMASGLVSEEHLKIDRQGRPKTSNYNSYSPMSSSDQSLGSITVYDGSTVSMGNANDGGFSTEPIYDGNDGDGSNPGGIGTASVYDRTDGNGLIPDVNLENSSDSVVESFGGE